MTNGDLYDNYVKSCKDKNEIAEKYSAFNIKCRSLFNTQKLLRKKGADLKSSREDIISLNGRVLQKMEVETPVEAPKKASEKAKEIPTDSKKKNSTDKRQNNGKR